MSETVPPVAIVCECGNQIYEEVYMEGNLLAHAGGGLWRTICGHCVQCGKAFKYSISDQQISRAVIACKQLNPRGDEDGE
jgi:uncharacterized cysteine cluster protein YcgN (CxxCxxCC family)